MADVMNDQVENFSQEAVAAADANVDAKHSDRPRDMRFSDLVRVQTLATGSTAV
jgi:hypothetical protein